MIKKRLLKLRNRLHPSNKLQINKKANYKCLGNILKSKIKIPEKNQVFFEENTRLRNLKITVQGTDNQIIIGKNTYFSGIIDIKGSNNKLIIGDNTRINQARLICHHGTSITIGKNCLLSTDIDIRTTDSHHLFDQNKNKLNPDESITIEDNVWIGRMVSVLKGSHIGKGSVIGTMSLVNGTIPKSTANGGIPTCVIKENIHWEP